MNASVKSSLCFGIGLFPTFLDNSNALLVSQTIFWYCFGIRLIRKFLDDYNVLLVLQLFPEC